MKKQTFRKLAITFSAICFGTYLIIFACADDDAGSFWYSNFTPETFVEKSYSPLFFSEEEAFYLIGHDENYDNRFANDIVGEWYTYLEKKVEKSDLAYFITKNSSADVSDIYAYYTKKQTKKAYSIWSKKIDLKDSKINNLFEFLYFANQVDKCALQDENYKSWDYDKHKKTEYTDEDLRHSLMHKYETTSDLFLKNRYWFQTIKAGFYSKTKANAENFFEKTKNDAPKNTLYYRALSYIAGIHYENKDFAKANYLYSIAFDNCPSLRMVTAYNFHPQQEKDWNQSLALAKNNQEKAALWAVFGYYTDPSRAVNEIVNLDPESQHIDYLVTRIINQAESKIAGLYWDEEKKPLSIADYKKMTTSAIDKATIENISKIADEGKVKNKFLINVAAGYLQCLKGEYKNAENYYAKADLLSKKDRLSKDQLRLLRFINNLSEIETIHEKSEMHLLSDLQWLYLELPKDTTLAKPMIDANQSNLTFADLYTTHQYAFRFERATSWSRQYLSWLFSSKGDKTSSELFKPSGKFYHTSENIESMKNLMLKNNKTDFEKLALNIYPVHLADLYEYQSILFAFQNKLDQAISVMKLAEGNKDQILLANPFNGKIKDCHDCDFIAPQKAKFTQLDLLLKMKEMETKIENNEDVFNNSLLLGNAFYNITYFGNARLFYEGMITGEGQSTPWIIDPFYAKIFTDCSLAIKYYQKAFENAANKEQKAKCTYMLTKCERNNYYNTHIYNLSDEWENLDKSASFTAWDGFKKLKDEYSDTKYYKDLIEECGYFRHYLGKKK